MLKGSNHFTGIPCQTDFSCGDIYRVSLSQREGSETLTAKQMTCATRTLAQPEHAQLIYDFSALPVLR